MRTLAIFRPFMPGDERVRFRKADEAESMASVGTSCSEAVLQAHALGEVEVGCNPATGKPVAFFGCVPVDDVSAAVWMLATPELPKHKRAILIHAPQVIQGWHQIRPLLFNCVDARNTLHIQWLRRLGFTFIRLHDRLGPSSLPFYEFVRIPICVPQQPS